MSIKFEKSSQLEIGTPINGTFVGTKVGMSFKNKSQADAYRKQFILKGFKVYKDGEDVIL